MQNASREVIEPAGRGSRAREPLVAVLILFLLLAGGFFLWRQRYPAATTAAPTTAASTAAQPAHASAADEAETQAARSLATAGESADERLRTRLAALTPRAEWQQWLNATRDLIDSCAVLVSNFSEDEAPHQRLRALGVPPQGKPFEVIEENGHTVEAPAAARRFDLDVQVIDSIDVSLAAPLWRSLHPLVAVAYRPLARRGVSLDQAAGNALARIEHATVPATPPPLEKAGAAWIYSAPQDEQRGQIEKLLMRMGPENERVLQAKARALRAALALP